MRTMSQQLIQQTSQQVMQLLVLFLRYTLIFAAICYIPTEYES